jgi:PPE-repeat protein
MTEAEYVEMWAQDVAAMLGYHSQATSVASTLPQFSVPPGSLAGLAGLLTTPLANVASQFLAALSSAGVPFASQLQSVMAALSPAVSSVTSLLSTVPVSTMTSVAPIGIYPATALASPMIMMTQGAGQGAPALASTTTPATDAPTTVASSPVYGVQPLGGLGVASAGLAQARFVGAISVPPTWQGAMPAPMVTPVSSFGGGTPAASATPGTTGSGGVAMPVDDKGAQGGKSDEMMRRGGARPAVVQSRPKVVRRT